MAAPVTKINRRAVQQLLTSDVVVGDLVRRADNIAAACGGAAVGYVRAASTPRVRARAAVITATGHAIRDNAKSNTLLRNLAAGRR